MYEASAHGLFEIFNMSTTDAYLALRPQTSPYWQLYRMHVTATGFNLEKLGQHTTFEPGVMDHARKDAQSRHKSS